MSDTDTLSDQDLITTPQPSDLAPQACEDSASAPAAPHCGNCGELLLGPHCHACGQPEKSLVRQFPELIGDFFGTVFGLDSRIARTLGPLLVNPGFLTSEYFAGRRVRYVSPVRLFVFLCLTAFFAAKLSSDWRTDVSIGQVGADVTSPDVDLNSVEHDITSATTVEEVLRLRDQAIKDIAEISAESGEVPGVTGLLSGVEQIVRQRAAQRIAQLDPAAVAGPDEEEPQQITESQKITAPQIEGAPEAVNAWFVRQSAKLTLNISRIAKDPNLLKDALFSAIPSTLFVMLPFFALFLSLLYVFKRRLYMEHLIVALHSHAFLSLALLLMVLMSDLRAWLTEPHTLPQALFNLAILALGLWMPVYLLLMQKRVYGQGWPMTTLKFSVLGLVYFILLSTATTITALASIARL
ncbi:DUF3667 domain-containing protein [Microbulbifer sp.]|uniref:DUF3667 domain-containing protein n=1 Tax=Microbulbifer sp. TaxID=1908541 RepID=UPI002F952816